MTLSEVYLSYMEGTEASFNIIDQCTIYNEKIMNDYLNNLNDANIKVVEESENSDDLFYLEAAAKNEAVKKSQNIIVRLFKEFNNWVRTRFNKIKEWFYNKDIQKNIKTINTIVNENPDIKNKKIEIHDVKGIIGTCNKYYDKANVYDVEIRSGIGRNVDKIDTLRSNYDKEKEAMAKATTVITAATAISLLYWLTSSKEANIKEEKADDYYKNISVFTNPEDMVKLSNAASKISNLRFTIQKDKGNKVIQSVNEIVSKLKATVSGKHEVPLNFELPGKKINPLAESVSNIDEGFKERYVNNIFEDIELEESMSNITPEEYLEATVESLYGERDYYLESLTEESIKEAKHEDHINEILNSLDIN